MQRLYFAQTAELQCEPLTRRLIFSQSKYKEGGRKSLSQSFYSQLSETAETQFAKSVAELQSEVRSFLSLTHSCDS